MVRSTRSVFGVFLLIEDLEVLVCNFLVGRLRYGLLGFVVRGDGWFPRVEEPGGYKDKKLGVLSSL